MSASNIPELLAKQRAYFASGATLPFAARRDALQRLKQCLIDSEAPLLKALHDDLRKPAQEAYTSEIALVVSEIDHAIKDLKGWMKIRRSSVPWMVWPATARVAPRPLGVALIVAPWNYPVQLLILPLIGAIAAGNCSIVKPSELSPNCSSAISEMLGKAFPSDYVACVEGDRAVAEALLDERFDKIFFTGGAVVGRVVAAAAAKHLTPVTLELGGKCPVIVCADANIRVAARRIIWAKTMNAGQSCVAPDYLLAHESIRDRLIQEMQTALREMFGGDAKKSTDFGRIVNRRQFDRLVGYLGDGTVIVGGQNDPADLFIAPTLLENIPPDSPIMNDEIFGPLLPVLKFRELSEALEVVKARSAPLAVYLFSGELANRSEIEKHIRCGGICVNDLMVQLSAKGLPFGGVGESGMGNYHGKASFDCFSYQQSILHCATLLDPPFRYSPPKLSMRWFKPVIRWLLRG